jgi:hypothetical protein
MPQLLNVLLLLLRDMSQLVAKSWDKNILLECFENWILDKSVSDFSEDISIGLVSHQVRLSYGESSK